MSIITYETIASDVKSTPEFKAYFLMKKNSTNVFYFIKKALINFDTWDEVVAFTKALPEKLKSKNIKPTVSISIDVDVIEFRNPNKTMPTIWIIKESAELYINKATVLMSEINIRLTELAKQRTQLRSIIKEGRFENHKHQISDKILDMASFLKLND